MVLPRSLTICEAFVGGLCSEALAHQQLAVSVGHSVALVALYHTDWHQVKGDAKVGCS